MFVIVAKLKRTATIISYFWFFGGLSEWISELIKDHSLIKTSLNDFHNLTFIR